jgi:hypothetical protein
MSVSILDSKSKNFRVLELGRVDGSGLREFVSSLPNNVWHRNGAMLAAQQNTLSVPFLEVEDVIGGKDVTPACCSELYPKIFPLVESALKEVGIDLVKFCIVDLLLARLHPGADVFVHMDADYGTKQYAFWEGINRIHIPLTTNALVEFSVAGREFLDREAFVEAKGFKPDDCLNLKQDVVYQVNNLRFHSVRNRSELVRDHLIIDLRRRL